MAGAGVYYYILEEYKVSNGLLSEDIYVRFGTYLISWAAEVSPELPDMIFIAEVLGVGADK